MTERDALIDQISHERRAAEDAGRAAVAAARERLAREVADCRQQQMQHHNLQR